MKVFFILIIFVIANKLTNCLTYPSNLCFTSDQLTCTGEFKYQCDQNICANKKEHCDYYNMVKKLTECYMCKHFKTNRYNLNMNRLNKFMKSIKDLIECSLCKKNKNVGNQTVLNKKIKFIENIKECHFFNKYLPENVCHNTKKCYKIIWPIEMFDMNIKIVPSGCKCEKRHSYMCTNNFCTNNLQTCDQFKSTNKSAEGIVSCNFK